MEMDTQGNSSALGTMMMGARVLGAWMRRHRLGARECSSAPGAVRMGARVRCSIAWNDRASRASCLLLRHSIKRCSPLPR